MASASEEDASWKCPACCRQNDAKKPKCAVCGTKKGYKKASPKKSERTASGGSLADFDPQATASSLKSLTSEPSLTPKDQALQLQGPPLFKNDTSGASPEEAAASTSAPASAQSARSAAPSPQSASAPPDPAAATDVEGGAPQKSQVPTSARMSVTFSDKLPKRDDPDDREEEEEEENEEAGRCSNEVDLLGAQEQPVEWERGLGRGGLPSSTSTMHLSTTMSGMTTNMSSKFSMTGELDQAAANSGESSNTAASGVDAGKAPVGGDEDAEEEVAHCLFGQEGQEESCKSSKEGSRAGSARALPLGAPTSQPQSPSQASVGVLPFESGSGPASVESNIYGRAMAEVCKGTTEERSSDYVFQHRMDRGSDHQQQIRSSLARTSPAFLENSYPSDASNILGADPARNPDLGPDMGVEASACSSQLGPIDTSSQAAPKAQGEAAAAATTTTITTAAAAAAAADKQDASPQASPLPWASSSSPLSRSLAAQEGRVEAAGEEGHQIFSSSSPSGCAGRPGGLPSHTEGRLKDKDRELLALRAELAEMRLERNRLVGSGQLDCDFGAEAALQPASTSCLGEKANATTTTTNSSSSSSSSSGAKGGVISQERARDLERQLQLQGQTLQRQQMELQAQRQEMDAMADRHQEQLEALREMLERQQQEALCRQAEQQTELRRALAEMKLVVVKLSQTGFRGQGCGSGQQNPPSHQLPPHAEARSGGDLRDRTPQLAQKSSHQRLPKHQQQHERHLPPFHQHAQQQQQQQQHQQQQQQQQHQQQQQQRQEGPHCEQQQQQQQQHLGNSPALSSGSGAGKDSGLASGARSKQQRHKHQQQYSTQHLQQQQQAQLPHSYQYYHPSGEAPKMAVPRRQEIQSLWQEVDAVVETADEAQQRLRKLHSTLARLKEGQPALESSHCGLTEDQRIEAKRSEAKPKEAPFGEAEAQIRLHGPDRAAGGSMPPPAAAAAAAGRSRPRSGPGGAMRLLQKTLEESGDCSPTRSGKAGSGGGLRPSSASCVSRGRPRSGNAKLPASGFGSSTPAAGFGTLSEGAVFRNPPFIASRSNSTGVVASSGAMSTQKWRPAAATE